MNEVIAKLVSTAWELARIQIEGVTDWVGFNNADKTLGAHLATIVETDPTDEDSVRRLAALVGVKYQRQCLAMSGVGLRYVNDFKALAKGTKLTKDDRFDARMTIVAQPNVHPKFGARILFSFQYNENFAYILKDNGARAFHGPDGFKWAVPMSLLETIVAKLKAAGARIVGSLKVDGIVPEPVEKVGRVIKARFDGKYVYLKFRYDRAIVEAVRELPDRRYSGDSQEWRINASDLGLAAEHLGRIGNDVDVTALIELASKVPQVARPIEAGEPTVNLDGYIPDYAKDFQREGIPWLVRPLAEARKSCVGGSKIRGYILADKPGLGKTMQAAIASKAILETMKPEGRIVVVTPGNHKIGWAREIRRYCGDDQTIHVCNGDLGPDPKARWNIVNYDILLTWYTTLVAMGFDILILDEAHYAKNYESTRAKLVVGGTVKFPKILTEAEKERILEGFIADRKAGKPASAAKVKAALNPKEALEISGLAELATLRVFPLTGTPLDNRPKDLFNILKAIGHPLGSNFRQFGMRYCDPTFKQVGKRVVHEYDGRSNLAELRERLAPVFLQRHDAGLKGKLYREWTPVEIDIKEYKRVIAEYDDRRKCGELKSSNDHLSYISEARRCAALAMVGATIESVESALEADEKVIVFSYYTDVIDRLKMHFGDSSVVIDGSVSSNIGKDGSSKRQAAMDKFQNDPECKVLIGQFTAAGIAVTLTAATQVKFNDLDWKPGTHFQCEKRAHRIGQTKDVFVEYMVAAGTFYEELATMLEDKLQDMNEFEGTDESLFLNLIERLNNEAPKNEEAKKLMAAREMRRAA